MLAPANNGWRLRSCACQSHLAERVVLAPGQRGAGAVRNIGHRAEAVVMVEVGARAGGLAYQVKAVPVGAQERIGTVALEGQLRQGEGARSHR